MISSSLNFVIGNNAGITPLHCRIPFLEMHRAHVPVALPPPPPPQLRPQPLPMFWPDGDPLPPLPPPLPVEETGKRKCTNEQEIHRKRAMRANLFYPTPIAFEIEDFVALGGCDACEHCANTAVVGVCRCRHTVLCKSCAIEFHIYYTMYQLRCANCKLQRIEYQILGDVDVPPVPLDGKQIVERARELALHHLSHSVRIMKPYMRTALQSRIKHLIKTINNL